MLFTHCSKTDSCEICLPSFPNLRVMLLEGDAEEGVRGSPGSRRPSRAAGLKPGLCLRGTGKVADSALEQTAEKAFTESLGGVCK